jgi:hypothetical protein
LAYTDDVVGTDDGLYYHMTHEEQLQERKDYENFLDALAEAGKLCPPSCSRWFNEAVLENFEYTFEETLYYGDE